MPEKAISEEIGLKYFGETLTASVAFFNRDSDNLIDYTKENEADKWQSNNLKSLNSKFCLNQCVNAVCNFNETCAEKGLSNSKKEKIVSYLFKN